MAGRNSLQGDLLHRLEQAHEGTVHLLQDLVRFPSINPPGAELACSHYIGARLEQLGLAVEHVEAVPERPNVLARLTGRGGGRRLLFYGGHSDVVPPGDLDAWRADPFGGEIVGGWIIGRGTVDHKGPIAASIAALQAIRDANIELSGSLQYIVPVDEESGGRWGTEYLVNNDYLRGDLGIYGSPGEAHQIVIASKGLLQLQIVIEGRGGHGGTPWAIANPIEVASRVVQELKQLPMGSPSPYFHEPFGNGPGAAGTLSVTMIQAGERINVVPDRCAVYLDRRLVPEETVQEARSQIQVVLDRVAATAPGFKLAIGEVYAASPGVAIEASEPVVGILQRSAAVVGLTAGPAATFATSDTRFIVNDARIPMAAYGIGLRGPDGEICVHRVNECIRIEDLLAMAQVYALAIVEACGVV